MTMKMTTAQTVTRSHPRGMPSCKSGSKLTFTILRLIQGCWLVAVIGINNSLANTLVTTQLPIAVYFSMQLANRQVVMLFYSSLFPGEKK